MNITRTTKRNTIISSILFLAAVAVLIVEGQLITKAGANLKEEVAAASMQTDREQKYTELFNLIEKTTAERAELEEYLLSEDETIDFITEGEQMATQQRVLYTTDTLESIEGKDGYDQLEVSFTMEGAYEDVYHMLKILEASPRHSQLSSVNISSKSDTNEDWVEARVKLLVTLSDV